MSLIVARRTVRETPEKEVIQNGSSHIASPLKTLLESQAFWNCPKNDSTVSRSESSSRYGLMVVSMRLA